MTSYALECKQIADRAAQLARDEGFIARRYSFCGNTRHGATIFDPTTRRELIDAYVDYKSIAFRDAVTDTFLEHVLVPQAYGWLSRWLRRYKNKKADSLDALAAEISESESGELLVIDVQPDIKESRGVLEPILQLAEKSAKVVWVHDTQFANAGDEQALRGWLAEHGASDELLERVVFIPKEYGFARDPLDSGVDPDQIVEALRRLREAGVSDIRDLDGDDAELEGLWWPEQFADDLAAAVRRPTLVGGARHECLHEVRLVLETLGINYEVGPSCAIFGCSAAIETLTIL